MLIFVVIFGCAEAEKTTISEVTAKLLMMPLDHSSAIFPEKAEYLNDRKITHSRFSSFFLLTCEELALFVLPVGNLLSSSFSATYIFLWGFPVKVENLNHRKEFTAIF